MRRHPQQLAQAVRAVGQPGGHRRRALQPALARADSPQAQRLVRPAVVVGQPEQVQPALDERHALGRRAPAAHQRGEAFAQGGVEPLDVGGVDGHAAVAGSQRCGDGSLRPHDDAAHDPLAPLQPGLDHLGQREALRPHQRRSPAPPRPLRHAHGCRWGVLRSALKHLSEDAIGGG